MTDSADAKAFNTNAYNQNQQSSIQLPIETLTEQDAQWYNLEQGTRLAVIFNHSKYKNDKERKCDPRPGTEKDVKNIKETFEKLKFKVEALEDPTLKTIKKKISDIQNRKNLSILALFILTHGDENGFLEANDSGYYLKETILNELLPEVCPTLAGRPKLIFIQACQGKKLDPGQLLNTSGRASVDSSGLSTPGEQMISSSYCIPNWADLLVYTAAFSGHYAFRNEIEGSWLIQSLCCEINDSKPDEDL